MTVVPPPAEYGGRATARPTAVRPSRGRLTEESVWPEPDSSREPSRVVPLALSPDRLVPVDPALPRGTACADRPSDDEPEGVDTAVGADRAWPPPDPPLLELPPPPSDPPLLPLAPPEPLPRRCWALALGEKAKTNAADVKIARRLCRRSGNVRVIRTVPDGAISNRAAKSAELVYALFKGWRARRRDRCPAISPWRPVFLTP